MIDVNDWLVVRWQTVLFVSDIKSITLGFQHSQYDGHHRLKKTLFFITPFNVSEDYLDSVQFCFDREVIVS